MLRILRDRFIALGRDEDGAALVITLAVIMFIYLLFIGIWAVGTNVRTRIHLQNACDAAAYSAAVVQADTLSRIATINRAMAWTYVQMTKHQQDYILFRLMAEVSSRYGSNMKRADWIGVRENDEQLHVKINGRQLAHIADVQGAVARNLGVGALLVRDRVLMAQMNSAQDSLVASLSGRVTAVAQNVASANAPKAKIIADLGWQGCVRNMFGYEEAQFRNYAGDNFTDYDWLPRIADSNGFGFGRTYAQQVWRLQVDWSWHEHGTTRWHNETVKGSDREVFDNYFYAFMAYPKKLNPAYFGAPGTITVGLAADNQNPWATIMGDVSQGFFSAFEPLVKKTFCVASAKAGYRNFDDGASFGRDYRIDWGTDDEGTWNLYSSDWDAVLLPVPRAASQATDGAWGAAADALGAVATALGLAETDFRAGGTKGYKTNFTKDGSAYNWDQYLDLSGDDYVQGSAVNAKWQIGRPGQPVSSWAALQNRMWH